jgi:hypothetical protein
MQWYLVAYDLDRVAELRRIAHDVLERHPVP